MRYTLPLIFPPIEKIIILLGLEAAVYGFLRLDRFLSLKISKSYLHIVDVGENRQ